MTRGRQRNQGVTYNETTMGVIGKADKLVRLVMKSTENFPKSVRFVVTNRMQELAWSIYDNLLNANSVYIDFHSLKDLNKTIEWTKKRVNGNNVAKDAEYYHYQNKLLHLRLTVAQKFDERIEERQRYQNQVLTDIKKLSLGIRISFEEKYMTEKTLLEITTLLADCRNMTQAWMTSDRKRFSQNDSSSKTQ